ncbi:hypothetical protein V1523DRAFT_396343 [Lipomyces doorenjongii]
MDSSEMSSDDMVGSPSSDYDLPERYFDVNDTFSDIDDVEEEAWECFDDGGSQPPTLSMPPPPETVYLEVDIAKKSIQAWARNHGYAIRTQRSKARNVRTLRQLDPGTSVTRRDSHNLRADIKRKELGGLSLIQALLFQLDEDSDYISFDKRDENQRVIRLLFIHKSSIEMLRLHSEVLIMDSTYKTNRWQLLS